MTLPIITVETFIIKFLIDYFAKNKKIKKTFKYFEVNTSLEFLMILSLIYKSEVNNLIVNTNHDCLFDAVSDLTPKFLLSIAHAFPFN